MNHIIFHFLFILTPIFSAPTPFFCDNFQNSEHNIRHHEIKKADNGNILAASDSSLSTPTGGYLSIQTTVWGDRYIYKKGSPDCPLQSNGGCGIYYTYACSCSDKGGCDTCTGFNSCPCPEFYASIFNLVYINEIISTNSANNQFQITFEAEGQGKLDVFALFPVSSCPSNFLVRTLEKGKYANTPNSIDQISLSSTKKIVSILYTHTNYGCSLISKNQIMLAFNGKAKIRNLVVSNPGEINDLVLMGTIGKTMKYNSLYASDSKIIDSVTFEGSNSFDSSSLSHSYLGITKIIGSSQGMCTLKTFGSINKIVGVGSSNVLICGIANSYLTGGSSSTTFKIERIYGNCYIENFDISKGDSLDLTIFDSFHNYTQISNSVQSCGENCFQITFGENIVIIKNIDKSEAPNMKMIFKEYPCFNLCPDCRFPSDCSFCTNCVPGLCDLQKCHQCSPPFYLYRSLCIDKCDSGVYVDKTNRKCYDCSITNCLACDQDYKCFSCEEPTFLYKGKCLETCPERTYSFLPLNSQKLCIDCSSDCEVCDSNGCLICDPGFLRYIKDEIYKCVPESCFYDEQGECVQAPEEIPEIYKPDIIKEIKNGDFIPDALNYLITDYDEKNNFICQASLEEIGINKCMCYEMKKNLGFLAISAMLKYILKRKGDAFVLCSKYSSIYDKNCFFNTQSFDLYFKNQVTFEKEIFVLQKSNFNGVSYDVEKFRSIFNMIRGPDEYFVIITILNGTKQTELLLIQWELQLEGKTINSFGTKEIFVVADTKKGCNDIQKRRYSLKYTYGKNDDYFIKSFILFKRIDQNTANVALNNSDICKNYIGNYERCRLKSDKSFFEIYERHMSRATSWTPAFRNLSLNQKCALVDLFFEVGEINLINFKEFKEYIDNQNFTQTFESQSDIYQNSWINNSRIQMALQIISGKKQLKNEEKIEKCDYTLFHVQDERSCDVKKINGLIKQLLEIFSDPNNYFKKIPLSDYSNLVFNDISQIFVLERNTSIKFEEVLLNNPNFTFKVKSGIKTYPEVFLLSKWQIICKNISKIEDNAKIYSRLSGEYIEIENSDEVKNILINNGFEDQGDNIFSLVSKNSENHETLRGENIKCLQKLWNSFHKEEIINEDGIFSNEMEKKLEIISKDGFKL